MENKNRIEESLKRQDQMVAQLTETNQRLSSVDQRLSSVDQRLSSVDQRLYVIEIKSGKVEEQLIKLNLQTTENTRAIFKLAENVEQIADLHKRVTKLEKTVFK